MRQWMCSSHLTALSTHRLPAYPISVPIAHPREVRALSSQALSLGYGFHEETKVRQWMCSSHLTALSTHRLPAYPISVPIAHPREVRALSSQALRQIITQSVRFECEHICLRLDLVPHTSIIMQYRKISAPRRPCLSFCFPCVQ